jgi:predicted CXXCH cytochrome family protein
VFARYPFRCFSIVVLEVSLLMVLTVFAHAQNPIQNPTSDKYVGAEVCEGCHEDSYKTFADSAHIKTLKRAARSEQGCEGCHGPGADHAEAGDPDKIRRFAGVSQPVIQAACTVCHEANLGAAHTRAQLTCLTCHSVHHYQQVKSILVASSTRVCLRCHKF